MRHDSKRVLAAASATLILLLATPVLASCSSAGQSGTPSSGGPASSPAASSPAPATSAGGSSDTSVGVGNDVPLPDNWPAVIPTYQGGSLVSVVVVGDAAELNASWLTDAPTPKAAADMAAAMAAAGFTSGAVSSTSDMSSVDYAGNGYTVNVTVYSSAGKSNVSINASKD